MLTWVARGCGCDTWGLRRGGVHHFIIEASGVPLGGASIPRFHPPKVEPSGLSIAYLVDLSSYMLE